MSEQAAALLRKYDIAHGKLELLGRGTNTSWRAHNTPYLVRVADQSVDNGMLQVGLRAAIALQNASLPFVNPAFPLVIQTSGKTGPPARGTLWFYEEVTGEPTDYRQLGAAVRALQEEGTAVVAGAGLGLPEAMSARSLQEELDDMREHGHVEEATYELLNAWIPRIERGASRLGETRRVLVHGDLWAENALMTPARGLVLCDPDNLAWGRPDFDLASISRGREAGLISRDEVRAFEDGYKGRIPDLNTAWRMALYRKFRSVCNLIERQDGTPELCRKLNAEVALWRRKRGPQPG